MELERIETRAEKNEEFSTTRSEQDLLPEFCHYRDAGCELAASCLNCPFNKCLYEEPGGKQHYLKKRRNREIVRLFAEGNNVRQLSAKFGVSQRTIQRALKRAKNE